MKTDWIRKHADMPFVRHQNYDIHAFLGYVGEKLNASCVENVATLR